MDVRIEGAAGPLEAWLAPPPNPGPNGRPGMIIVPGFPAAPGGGPNSFRTFPALADRVAEDARMVALAFAFRGISQSDGNFSLEGWLEDLRVAIDYLRAVDGIDGAIWMMGFGTGGALAVAAAAGEPDIAGIVSVGAPADFMDWASRPRELLSHARKCGAISDPEFPNDVSEWTKELQEIAAVESAAKLDADQVRLMVLHGSSENAVPPVDARAIADAHGAAELRILEGGRHHLRHDPRAMAAAIGFLNRRGRPPQARSLST